MGLTIGHKANIPFLDLTDAPYLFWTLSGSGTGEYYYNQAHPLTKPFDIIHLTTPLTEGTLGSLSAGQWAYGDNDSLGYNTYYVRLTGDADPNGLPAGDLQTTAPTLINVASYTGTINIGMILYNNEEDTADDAKILFYMATTADVPRFIEMFDLKGTDGPVTEQTKFSMLQTDKLYIMSSRENVSVIITRYEDS